MKKKKNHQNRKWHIKREMKIKRNVVLSFSVPFAPSIHLHTHTRTNTAHPLKPTSILLLFMFHTYKIARARAWIRHTHKKNRFPTTSMAGLWGWLLFYSDQLSALFSGFISYTILYILYPNGITFAYGKHVIFARTHLFVYSNSVCIWLCFTRNYVI